MAVKVHPDLLRRSGWDKVEEYGNKRLSEDGLDDFEISIRPATLKEKQEIMKEYNEVEEMANSYFDKEKKTYEIAFVINFDDPLDAVIVDYKAFVESEIICALTGMIYEE